MVSTQQQQVQKSFGQQHQQHLVQQQHQSFDDHHGEEIQQQSLKSTLQSAITDIEQQVPASQNIFSSPPMLLQKNLKHFSET